MVVVVTIDRAGWVVEALAQTVISIITVEKIQPSGISPESRSENKEHTSDHKIITRNYKTKCCTSEFKTRDHVYTMTQGYAIITGTLSTGLG